MKWGVRRYQNSDGTLTAEGREHYKTKVGKTEDRIQKLNRKSARVEKRIDRVTDKRSRLEDKKDDIRLERATAFRDKSKYERDMKRAYRKGNTSKTARLQASLDDANEAIETTEVSLAKIKIRDAKYRDALAKLNRKKEVYETKISKLQARSDEYKRLLRKGNRKHSYKKSRNTTNKDSERYPHGASRVSTKSEVRPARWKRDNLNAQSDRFPYGRR